MNYSKRKFLSNKMKTYKKKLQRYRHFQLKHILYYEKQWQYINLKFNRIILHGIQFVSIGETVPRLFNLIEDLNKEDKKVLHVVLPVFFDYYSGGIYNRRMFDIFGKKIYFIKDSNLDVWTYIFLFHASRINMEYFDKYKSARLGPTKVSANKYLLPFTNKERKEGERKMKEIGVQGEFICIHAREAKVKLADFNKRAAYESKCRECDIGTFEKTCRYFMSKNIQSVRMGKYETHICNTDFMIDYANLYHDEFMDFYLSSKCKFFIGCDSGLQSISGFYGKPVVATNMTSICYGGESLADSGYDLYMPKKFYSKTKKRYLNLYEMLDAMNVCAIKTSEFVKNRIVLEDNTEDEILEAAKEMNARIEKQWKETIEEKKHYEKYWRILEEWKTNNKVSKVREDGGFAGYTMNFYKISYTFLKNNLYLLDI